MVIFFPSYEILTCETIGFRRCVQTPRFMPDGCGPSPLRTWSVFNKSSLDRPCEYSWHSCTLGCVSVRYTVRPRKWSRGCYILLRFLWDVMTQRINGGPIAAYRFSMPGDNSLLVLHTLYVICSVSRALLTITLKQIAQNWLCLNKKFWPSRIAQRDYQNTLRVYAWIWMRILVFLYK